ncbi:tetratricopeptide repeat protein [candidate division KSB1 bacterium]|nr:tetratricopeptide repeat protein [candidate division KSB1 bacterium]
MKKVLALEPKYSVAPYRIGLTYYHLGQFDEAVEHLKR